MNKLDFLLSVEETLSKHPDWMNSVIQSCCAGVMAALKRADKQRAECDMAMLAALTLAKPGRLSSGSIAELEEVIVRALAKNGTSPIEREFIARMEEKKTQVNRE